MSGIDIKDIKDPGIVSAAELSADGTDNYNTSVTVTSTTSSSKQIVFSGVYLIHDADDRAESGDKVILSGTSGADGTYTINTVIDDTTVSVVESINDSTDGTAEFRHPPGSTRVGIDPTNIEGVTSTELQEGLEQLSQATGSDDKKVQVDATDASYDYLYDKLQAGSDVTLSKVDTGGGVKVVKIDSEGRWWRRFLIMGG